MFADFFIGIPRNRLQLRKAVYFKRYNGVTDRSNPSTGSPIEKPCSLSILVCITVLSIETILLIIDGYSEKGAHEGFDLG